jgi:hypothetical protein
MDEKLKVEIWEDDLVCLLKSLRLNMELWRKRGKSYHEERASELYGELKRRVERNRGRRIPQRHRRAAARRGLSRVRKDPALQARRSRPERPCRRQWRSGRLPLQVFSNRR